MQLQQQDRVGSTPHLSIFKLHFTVTALRFNQTHVQACGGSCSDLSPLAEPVPEDEFPLHPVTAGEQSPSQAFSSVALGAEHPSSLQGGHGQCGSWNPPCMPG